MSGGARKNVDLVLVGHLAGGKTVAEAARLVGCSDATVRRRLQQPAFRERVTAAQKEMTERALAVLIDGQVAASATLRLLLEQDQPPAVRLGAARTILELVSRLGDLRELEERIATLEGAR